MHSNQMPTEFQCHFTHIFGGFRSESDPSSNHIWLLISLPHPIPPSYSSIQMFNAKGLFVSQVNTYVPIGKIHTNYICICRVCNENSYIPKITKYFVAPINIANSYSYIKQIASFVLSMFLSSIITNTRYAYLNFTLIQHTPTNSNPSNPLEDIDGLSLCNQTKL